MKVGGKFGKVAALWRKTIFLILNSKLVPPVSGR